MLGAGSPSADELPGTAAGNLSSRRLIQSGQCDRFRDTNIRPFNFHHALQLQPIFNVAEIMALADRLPDNDGFKAWQNGDVELDSGWGTKPCDRLSLEETLGDIANSNSIVLFKHVEQDPVFGPVLRQLLQEMFDLAPARFQEDVVIGEILIFVNSPHRVTPYHFDLEPSFLMQVAGEKTVHAWPSGDLTLVPHSELEDYCGAGILDAGRYKAERQADAMHFRIAPGDGVHFPGCGPHWVQNGDDVSISINVNFELRSLHHTMQNAYAFNHRLRKFGFSPGHPGRNPWLDGIKAELWSKVRTMRRMSRRVRRQPDPVDSYPTWQPRR
jgi:hypothetical protein